MVMEVWCEVTVDGAGIEAGIMGWDRVSDEVKIFINDF